MVTLLKEQRSQIQKERGKQGLLVCPQTSVCNCCTHGYKEANWAIKRIFLWIRIHEESNSIYKRKSTAPYISFAN